MKKVYHNSRKIAYELKENGSLIVVLFHKEDSSVFKVDNSFMTTEEEKKVPINELIMIDYQRSVKEITFSKAISSSLEKIEIFNMSLGNFNFLYQLDKNLLKTVRLNNNKLEVYKKEILNLTKNFKNLKIFDISNLYNDVYNSNEVKDFSSNEKLPSIVKFEKCRFPNKNLEDFSLEELINTINEISDDMVNMTEKFNKYSNGLKRKISEEEKPENLKIFSFSNYLIFIWVTMIFLFLIFSFLNSRNKKIENKKKVKNNGILDN